jgi:NAD-dependent SIR2 family protein deacetylase
VSHVWEIGYTEWPADKPCSTCGSARNDADVESCVAFFHEDVSEYEQMYELIALLDNENCIVAIGTSEQVLPFHILLHDVPGYKVLCNLEPLHSKWLDKDLFGKMVYAKAESAEVIDLTIRGWMPRWTKREIVAK